MSFSSGVSSFFSLNRSAPASTNVPESDVGCLGGSIGDGDDRGAPEDSSAAASGEGARDDANVARQGPAGKDENENANFSQRVAAEAAIGEGSRADEENDAPTIYSAASDLSPSSSSALTEATTDASVVSVVSNSHASDVEGRRSRKQLEKMQRRVPGSLDLDYVTPRIIGMAPPRERCGEDGDAPPQSGDPVQKSLVRQQQQGQGRRQKRQKGNDPGELSTFLERRHPRRHLLFNVSDDDADERSLLLLGGQVVHLPWGSPRAATHHHELRRAVSGGSARAGGGGNGDSGDGGAGEGRKNSSCSGGGGSKSSGTPAVSRVMDICYALHAYLSVPPRELPQELSYGSSGWRQNLRRQRRMSRSSPPSTVACIYCGNGKTRTGVIVACYLRFCNEVPDALNGFETFCERRNIMSSSASSSSSDTRDISSHIPPSLRQFFGNFDEVVRRREYPYPEPLMLQSIQLQGVPVDDMPCIDIWEHGDVPRRQIYSSHDDTSLNEWDDEEGSYKIGELLDQDFTLVCRFGGEFTGDSDDPSKVLFRYVNCPNFLGEGTIDLGMAEVDMMRRYAESFDDEDFLLTLVFDRVGKGELNFGLSPGRKRSRALSLARRGEFADGGTKFDGRIPEEANVILEGWRVLSDAHLSHLSPILEDELELGFSARVACLGKEIDFRRIALQFTNGDADSAKLELTSGLFASLFESAKQEPMALDNLQQPILEFPGDDSVIDIRASVSSNGTVNDKSCSNHGGVPEASAGDNDDSRGETSRPSSVPSKDPLNENSESMTVSVRDTDRVLLADPSEVGNDQGSKAHALHRDIDDQLDKSVTAEKKAGDPVRAHDSEEGNDGELKDRESLPRKTRRLDRGVDNDEQSSLRMDVPRNEVSNVHKAQHESLIESFHSTDSRKVSETSEAQCVDQPSHEKCNDENFQILTDANICPREEYSSTNNAFSESQSSLLEAIKMRGLKNSITTMGRSGPKPSLLVQIRRNGSSGSNDVLAGEPVNLLPLRAEASVAGVNSENNEPSTVDTEEAAAAVKEGIINTSDAIPATPILKGDGVVDLGNINLDYNDTSSIGSPPSEAAVMMLGLDQSMSTGVNYSKENSVCDDDSQGVGACDKDLAQVSEVRNEEADRASAGLSHQRSVKSQDEEPETPSTKVPDMPVTYAVNQNGTAAQIADALDDAAIAEGRAMSSSKKMMEMQIESNNIAESEIVDDAHWLVGDNLSSLDETSAESGMMNAAAANIEALASEPFKTSSSCDALAAEVPNTAADYEGTTDDENASVPPLTYDPEYEKYFRMLRAGLPTGAVKNGMQRDGIDPNILDLDPSKPINSQMCKHEDSAAACEKRTPVNGSNDESKIEFDFPDVSRINDYPRIADDPRFSKYFRMVKTGLPMDVVKHAMVRDQQDPSVMDLNPEMSLESQRSPKCDYGNDYGPPLKDNQTYEKYFRMRKMGLPMGAVKNAMQRDGLDPSIMDLDPNVSLAIQMMRDSDGSPSTAISVRAKCAVENSNAALAENTNAALPTPPTTSSNLDNANNALNTLLMQRGGRCASGSDGKVIQDDPKAEELQSKPAPFNPQDEQGISNSAITSTSRLDPKTEGMLPDRVAPSFVHQEEEEETADPRGALTAMLCKRAALSSGVAPKSTKPSALPCREDATSALDTMLSNRGMPCSSGQDEEGEEKDPRAALTAMLSKRAPPCSVREHKSHQTSELSGGEDAKSLLSRAVPSTSGQEEDENKESRAASTATLSKRAPQSSRGEHELAQTSASSDGRGAQHALSAMPSSRGVINSTGQEEEEKKDPRLTLTAMLSARASVSSNSGREDAKHALKAMLSNRGGQSAARQEDVDGRDPRTALTAILSKQSILDSVLEPNNIQTTESSGREGAKNALNAMLLNRGVQSSSGLGDDEEEKDPKAALTAMLSNRASASSEVEPKGTKLPALSGREGASNALNAMLSSRGVKENDPRAALTAMLSKRAPPSLGIEQNVTKSSASGRKGTRNALNDMLSCRGVPSSIDQGQNEIKDPRPALMAKLSKQAPSMPGKNGLSAMLLSCDGDESPPNAMLSNHVLPANVPLPQSQEDKNEDPRSALMTMLKNRNPTKPTNSSGLEGKAKQGDPRAALMTMLSKRAPPTPSPPPIEKHGQEDPRAALMSMLKNRAPQPNPPSSDGKTKTEDPKAALTTMLGKRATLAPPKPKNVPSSSKEEIKQPDPRSALMTMLSNRASPTSGNVPSTPIDQVKKDDPRSSLMSMLNKRAPPQPSEKLALEERSKQQDPRTAIMSVISKPTRSVTDKKGLNPELDSKNGNANEQVTNSATGIPPSKESTPEKKSSDDSPKIRDDPRFSKYFRMLKMGLPMGAVKNAMGRDQQDSTIMDLDPERSLESQRPPEQNKDDGPPLNQDPKYAKYFRMLKMGLSMGAVKNAMQRDGADPDVMDLDPNKSVASQMKKDDEGPPLKDDPKYVKYFKMLKMGLPMGAVKNALQRDGLDPSIMDLDPEKSVSSQLDEHEDDGPPLKEDPKYAKYFKMLKMGLPMGAVKNAMQRDGLDPSIMDLDPEKSIAGQLDDEEDTGPPLKEDPKYVKYFKMLKMGLPLGAVKNALQRDGLDASVMDLDPEKSVASQLGKEEEIVDSGPPLKEDPTYSKYFKMLKMGLPMGAVQNALQRDGHDPAIMDLDPEKSVEYQKAMATGRKKKKKAKKSQLKGPKKPKVRRKKIYWSPIEESKIDGNSLWSMVRGTFNFDSLKVDQAEFANLFTDTSNPGEKKKQVAKESSSASKQKKSVQVIDAKRGMNGGIILARIKVEFSVLAEMVMEMDCGKLDDTQLKALRDFLPTKEEKFAIEGYMKGASSSAKTKEAAINDFCACEKYMLAMMKVDMADEKFEAMLFKYQFDAKLNENMDGVTTLISACEEVQKSVRLRKLMAMILMLGNQINTGGTGNMAHGFTLDALLKLDEAKAFDKKTSVLQYLVKLVKANEPDLLNVHEEMPSIGPAENVIVETLVSELKELNDQLTNVKGTAAAEGHRKREGEKPEHNESALDRLRHQKTKIKDVEGVHMYNQSMPVELTAMEKFVLYAEKRTKEAFARIDEVQENFKGVLCYFGEDPAMTSSDFFGTLNKFIATFDSALEVVKRIEALKLAEEKKAAAKRAKELTKKACKAVVAAKNISGLAAKQTKGKLDLAGQRKQYADPFAGPDRDADVEARSKNSSNGNACRSPHQNSKPQSPHQNLMRLLEAKPIENEGKKTPSSPSSSLEAARKEGLPEAKEEHPRAALMAMISKRASPAEEPITSANSKKEERDKDPRAALMTMISKRADPVEKQSSAPAPSEEAKVEDPRAALIAMISKRAAPVEEPKSTSNPNGEAVNKNPIGKCAAPAEDPKSTPNPSDEPREENPRTALMAMISKRAAPAEEPELVPNTKEGPQHGASPWGESETQGLSPNSDEPKSTSNLIEKTKAQKENPRAALLAMISKRGAPVEEPKSAPNPKENPRAALIAMISQRAASAEEPERVPNTKEGSQQGAPQLEESETEGPPPNCDEQHPKSSLSEQAYSPLPSSNIASAATETKQQISSSIVSESISSNRRSMLSRMKTEFIGSIWDIDDGVSPPASPGRSSPSREKTASDIKGNMKPETVKRSAREERYEKKTSSNAREHTVPLDGKVKKDSPVPEITHNEKETEVDAKTEAKVMLVAAMAAAAAKNRKSTETDMVSAKEKSPAHNSVIEAEKQKSTDIALKLAKPINEDHSTEIDFSPLSAKPKGAARGKVTSGNTDIKFEKQKSDNIVESENQGNSTSTSQGNASPKRNELSKRKLWKRGSDIGDATMGIAAMAAAAARKKHQTE